MNNGHHHSTSYKFLYNSESGTYLLRAVGFKEMPGCWSLRWTTSENDNLTSSQFLTEVIHFKNLTNQKMEQIKAYCEVNK
jgi:hypothetical protein